MTSNLQQRIQTLLDQAVASGAERGIQVAAYYKGKLIVDAFAGTFDQDRKRPVDGNTLFPIFSTGKGIAATAIHALVQKKVLDYDQPIAHYWPEFACNGKSKVTLRQALNHSAALPQMPDCRDMGDVCDWDAMCRRIAQLTPLWEPGTRIYYHAITYTWLLGEPARRADGRPFAQIIQEEVCKPLKIDAMYFGIPDEVEDRVAFLEKEVVPPAPPTPPPANQPPDPAGGQSIPPWVLPLEAFMNRSDIRRACVPSSNGIMTAKALARHYAGLLSHELLSPETLRRATQLNRPPGQSLPQLGGRFGLGYALRGPEHDVRASFGHGGYGGSTGFADQRIGLAVGITKNVMGVAATATSILGEFNSLP